MDDEKKKKLLHQFELSRLQNSTQDNVIKDKTLSEGFNKTIKGTDKIDTKGIQKIASTNDWLENIAKKKALMKAGKKVMGVVPMAGAIGGLLSGDPAMAAEEAAGDIPFVGQAYEAIKPADTGNVEEERQMIAERDAREAYAKSPAHLARLRALYNIGK